MSERDELRILHQAIDSHHVEMCNCGDPVNGNHTAGELADFSLWSHYEHDIAYPDPECSLHGRVPPTGQETT